MNNPSENEMQECPNCNAHVADYELKDGGCTFCIKTCQGCLDTHGVENVRFINADVKENGRWIPKLLCEECYDSLWETGDVRVALIEIFK